MEDKKKVEAVLFSIGREVSTEKIAELCGLEREKVRMVMTELKEEYESRDHSLRINQRGNLWKLTVKDEFIPLVSKLVEGTDLDKTLMETLAVIAWKYPCTQSEVIRLRHNKAYEHIRKLMELEFVEKERTGRTYKLKLTKKFFEYFDLPSEEAKKAFWDKVPERVQKEAERVEKEAGEAEERAEKEKKEKGVREEIKGAMEEVRKAAKDGAEKKEEPAKTVLPQPAQPVAEKKRVKREKAKKKKNGEDDKEELSEEAIEEMMGAGEGEEDGGDEDEEGNGEEEKIEQGMSMIFG